MSVPGAQPKRAVSWIFDVTIMVAGGLVGVVALGDLLFGGHLDMQWTLALLIGAPIAALMSRFPLVLNRSSSGIEVGFDSAVLVFLVCFHGGAGALGIWAVGQALSQVNRHQAHRRPHVQRRAGRSCPASCAVAVMTWVGDLGSEHAARAERGGPRLRRVLPRRLPGLRRVARAGGPDPVASASCARARGLAALGVFVAIDSLGYLAALVAARACRPGRSCCSRSPCSPSWSRPARCPGAASTAGGSVALFDAAAEAQVVESRDRARDAAARQRPRGGREPARRAARGGPAAEGDRRPGPRGRPRRCGWWRRRSTGPAPRSRRDRKALEALATVGEEAFSRLQP